MFLDLNNINFKSGLRIIIKKVQVSEMNKRFDKKNELRDYINCQYWRLKKATKKPY